MEKSTQKLLVARAQLGTATQLFLDDCEPASIHVLACGAAELLSGIASGEGRTTIAALAAEARPDLTNEQISKMRGVIWNALKHFNTWKGRPRDDDPLLRSFSDEDNDSRLFEAWFHYGQIEGRLPLEAQVIQLWVLALSDQLNADERAACNRLFPGIRSATRHEQKVMLRMVIEEARKANWLASDPQTEVMPLLLSLSLYRSLQGKA